ncbi:MAG TPA: Dna2/Cas4 domain-containing protein [Anaerolineales bacterium]|nr:Dna2/Cas4 domain-containing protein [Anaerolineales bacterium]
MSYLLVALFVAGVLLIWLSRRAQASAGLPPGRVVSIDALPRQALEQPLYDPVTDLAGRPDYLVQVGRGLVPVEVKSGRAHAGPRPGHVLQLAAYCRLVQVHSSRRPPYGILKYADRAFAVDYTPSLERELMQVLDRMREVGDGPPDRSHESPARCRACGVRHACDQRLA